MRNSYVLLFCILVAIATASFVKRPRVGGVSDPMPFTEHTIELFESLLPEMAEMFDGPLVNPQPVHYTQQIVAGTLYRFYFKLPGTDEMYYAKVLNQPWVGPPKVLEVALYNP